MLIYAYEALVTDKSKISLLSSVLALTRKSRVRTPTRVTRITEILTRSTPNPAADLGTCGILNFFTNEKLSFWHFLSR